LNYLAIILRFAQDIDYSIILTDSADKDIFTFFDRLSLIIKIDLNCCRSWNCADDTDQYCDR